MDGLPRVVMPMLKLINQWIARIPFRLHWFFVIFTVALLPWLTRNTDRPGEWFPFSNFPMYSTFAPTAYYVYITDLNDQPLPMVPVFGNWSSGIKKIYDSYLKEEVRRLKAEAILSGGKYSRRIVQMDGEECRPAGDATLQQLLETSRHAAELQKHEGFRLYQVDITLEDGQIVQRTKLVGEVRS